ncbi:MAG: hypothetical protein ACPL7D_01425 [Candidatus Sumerlaeaceae bacterium]|jgi:2-iminoacetate synthase ThiH
MAASMNITKHYYTPDLSRLKAIASEAPLLSPEQAQEILDRSEIPALSLPEVAGFVKAVLSNPVGKVTQLVLEKAVGLRRALFSDAVVPMAPMEIANTCASDCIFCGWRISNSEMKRLRMPDDLILLQVEYLLDLGINYIEFVSGDDLVAVRQQLPRLLARTKELFQARGVEGKTCFCTLALTEKQYSELRDGGADAMIVWQETYDPDVFARYVTDGPKAFGIRDDWTWDKSGNGWLFRYQSQERALRAGLEVALGTMLGLNPDVTFEFLATVDHARYLLDNYSLTPEHPLIIGMPIWNPIPTRTSDMRRSDLPDIEKLFPVFAALYLLSLPTPATWVFPNCRVPLTVQVEAARVAGAFTSTEVKLGPGGYLPSVIQKMEMQGKNTVALRKRLARLLREAGENVDELARALDEREQFVHHYHAHVAYLRALADAGLSVVSGVRIPEVAKNVCQSPDVVVCGEG